MVCSFSAIYLPTTMESKPYSACLQDLNTVTSTSELETALGFINPASGSSKDAFREAVKAKLEEISENAVLVNNAKIRRRIKRLIQSFDPVEQAAPVEVEIPSSSKVKATSSSSLDLPSVIQSLNQAHSLQAVQSSLDSVVIPEKSDGGDHSVEFLKYRGPLKAALARIASDESITNKVLRKRISRLIFVLSTKEEQAKIGVEKAAAAAKVPAKGKDTGKAAKPSVGKPSTAVPAAPTTTVPNSAASINIATKSFEDCLASLNKATSAAEIETALGNVSVEGDLGSIESRQAVLHKLNDIIQNQSELLSNAKVRRKVTRLADSLAKTSVVVDHMVPWEIDTKPSSATAAAPSVASGAKANAAAATASSSSAGKTAAKSAAAAVKAAPVSEPMEVVDSADPQSSERVVGAPLESTIERVQAVTNAQELEDALADVKPESGNCGSRRKLKRAIDRLLLQENISSTINAKIRRRITRVLKYLEPTALSPEEASAAAKAARESAKNAKTAAAAEAKKQAEEEQAGKIPYVVFVGQLSYDTTAEDLEAHLRAHNIEGPINIRMLSDPQTQKFKGTAFVELEGARELHKCITLHHSKLKGRVINVEKSCGGKNKESRSAKLSEKRTEQREKVKESMDKVLQEYNDQGTIDLSKMGENFRNEIYKYTPGFVADVSDYLVCCVMMV